MLSLLNVEECELLGDSKYRAYISQVEKALKAFEATSEWADLISALGKLNKVLTNHVKYPVIPKRVTIGKRLAQCLHPALPSGVHLKALETYDIIFKCIGTQRLASDLFTYSAGLFPLLGYAALNVRPILLSLYENHFVPLGQHIKPGLTGMLLGLLPGLEDGSEYFERTTKLMEEFCESVGASFFYGCLWECVMASPAVRLQAINYVIVHFNKRQSMEDQLYFMGTNIDVLIQCLCSSVQDVSALVQRSALEMLLVGFPLHNIQLTKPDKVKLLTAAIQVVLRRDMSLNRRLYAWLLGTDANGNPISVQTGENKPASHAPPKHQRQDSVSTLNDDTDMTYFNTYSKDLLIHGIHNCIQDASEADSPDGKPSSLRPFRMLISLLDKPEIGSAILEDVLINLFRHTYREYTTLSLDTSEHDSGLIRNSSSNNLAKLGKKNGRLPRKDDKTLTSELIKTANLLFSSFETYFMWDFLGRTFEVVCMNSSKGESSLDDDKVKQDGPVSVLELCVLIAFLLEKVTLETYTETQTEHLPELLRVVTVSLNASCAELSDRELTAGLSLCSKILSKILPSMTPVSLVTYADTASLSDSLLLSHATESESRDEVTSNEGYLSADSEFDSERKSGDKDTYVNSSTSTLDRLKVEHGMKRAESFGSFKEFHGDVDSASTHVSPRQSPRKEPLQDVPRSTMQACMLSFQKFFCTMVQDRMVPGAQIRTLLMSQLGKPGSAGGVTLSRLQELVADEGCLTRVMYDRESLEADQHEVTTLRLASLSSHMCQAFSLACQLLVDFSCFPTYCTDQHSKLLKKSLKGDACRLPEWMNLLVLCACFVSSSSIQAAAVATILDLLGIIQLPSPPSEPGDEEHRDETWREESFNTLVRQPSTDNTVNVLIVPPLSPQLLHHLHSNTRFYQIVCGHLWNYLGEEQAEHHERGVELLNLLHQLAPTPWVCEDVIGNALLNDDSRVSLDAHKKFAVLWHLLREHSETSQPVRSSRTFDRSMFLMLDSLQGDVNPCRTLTQTWLTHCLQRGDIARLLEPIIVLLLHPDTARVSIQHVNIHKPRKVKLSEDVDTEDAETKIYAISSEGGNIIYHVSKHSRPYVRKTLEDSRKYALLTCTETGLSTKHGPQAEDPDFDKVNPKDLKLRVNPFGSSSSLDREPDKTNGKSVNFGQAKRLDKETCKKEGISFDDVDDGEDSKKGDEAQEVPIIETEMESRSKSSDATVTNGDEITEVTSTDTDSSSEGSSNNDAEQNEENIEVIVKKVLDDILDQVASLVKYEPPIVLQGSLSYMDSLDSVAEAQDHNSASRDQTPDDVFSNMVAGSKIQLDTDSDDDDNGNKDGEESGVHPLHTHLLLYTQRYDAQRSLYGLTCLKAILSTTPRLMACAISTTSISTSNTAHMLQLQHLLARHRRSVFGQNFYSEVPADALSNYRSIMYVEVLISVCLYYIRSYYPNLMMSTLKERELNGNKEVQILSCEILAMLLSELVSVARDSGKAFSTYISDLLSRCKVQKALMHCLLSSVYNNRQKQLKGDVNLTEAIISFNDENMDANTNETFQIKLLRLILVLILLEDQTKKYNTEEFINSEEKSRASQSSLPSSPVMKYVQATSIVNQSMLLSGILSALRQQHLCHLHRHWITMVTSALPYMGRALSHTVVHVVNQLCINLELLAYLYEHNIPKKGVAVPEKIPVDHVVTVLEGLTTLCHYCLLDNSQQDISVGHTLPSIGSDLAISPPIITNLIHVFTPQTTSREPSPAKDTSHVMSVVLEARRQLLSILPRILSTLTVLWKATTVSDAARETLAGKKPAWWTMGQPKAIRQQILELVSPVARHHGVNMMAAVAVVWNDRRQRNPSKRGQVIPMGCEDQLLLVELVAAIKVLPTDTLIQTIKQVMKSPPPTSQDRYRKRTPLEVSMVQFFYAYIQRTSAAHLLDSWSSLLALFKEGLQLSLTPPAIFLLLAILNDFVSKTPLFEERKDQKDLQEITQKLLEACSEIARASLEQTTWLRRNLAVKPGPQLDLLEHEDTLEAEPAEAVPQTENKSYRQYSVQALVMLAEHIAPLLDVIYSSEEKDRVVPFLNATMHHVFPYLRNHSPHNLPSFRACSQMLASMSSYQYTRKAWRRDAFDLLLDSSFFQMDEVCIGYWRTIIDNLMTHDKVTFKDLLARVVVTPSGSLNLFSSREQEFEQKAQLLKRLSFTLFCSEVDQYQRFMPDIQERLADSLRMTTVPSVQTQVFLCFRVLILRMSPQHLTSLWPTIITELVHVLLQFEQDLVPDIDEAKSQLARLANMDSSWALGNGLNGHHPSYLQLYLAACKLLDMALILPPETLPQFQLYRWAFTGDPGVDLDKLELDNTTVKQLKEHHPGFLPHVFRINRLLNLRFGTVAAQERVAGHPLLRCTHICSVRDLHIFFTTVANSAQSVDSFTCDQTVKRKLSNGLPKSKSAPESLNTAQEEKAPFTPGSVHSARINIEKMIETDFLENMPRI